MRFQARKVPRDFVLDIPPLLPPLPPPRLVADPEKNSARETLLNTSLPASAREATDNAARSHENGADIAATEIENARNVAGVFCPSGEISSRDV